MSRSVNIKPRFARFGAAFLLALSVGSLGAVSASAAETRTPPTCQRGWIQVAGPTTWMYGTHHLVADDGALIRVLQEQQPGIDLDKYMKRRVMACMAPTYTPPVSGPDLYYVFSISELSDAA